MNETLLLGIVILIVLFLIVNNRKKDSFEIREEDRPQTIWKPDIYVDERNFPIDDMMRYVTPSTRVTLYHKYNCTEFSPLASIFRIVKERMESPQVIFTEEVVDNDTCDGHYPMIMKRWSTDVPEVGLGSINYAPYKPSGLTSHANSGSVQTAIYDGTADFAELQDWILSDRIETLKMNYIPDKQGKNSEKYPTTNLDPHGTTHSWM